MVEIPERELVTLRDERDRWKDAYQLLATKTIYEGNSTYHWWAKAHAYKGIVFEVCEAFRKLGYTGEMGDLPTLPARLNEFVEKLLGNPAGGGIACAREQGVQSWRTGGAR